jgi:peptidoglycan-associated lipoprotein
MRKIFLFKLTALLVIAACVFVVSCQKKTVALKNEPVLNAKADETVEPADESEIRLSAIRENESDKMAEVVLQEDIYFEFDKATLTPESRETLVKNGEWLQINSDVIITIEGHCDERGTNEYNLALGERRANSVQTFLLDLGIDPSRLKTISFGEERPVAHGHNETAWAQNRRAHFLIR